MIASISFLSTSSNPCLSTSSIASAACAVGSSILPSPRPAPFVFPYYPPPSSFCPLHQLFSSPLPPPPPPLAGWPRRSSPPPPLARTPAPAAITDLQYAVSPVHGLQSLSHQRRQP